MRSTKQSRWITKPYLYALLTTLLVATGLLPARGSATSADSVAHLVKDINTHSRGSSPKSVGTLRNNLYFVTGSEYWGRLWRSDGTAAGTAPLARGFGDCGWAHVRERGFFCAADPDHGLELWQTDGTPANTRLLKDITPGTNSSSLAQIGSVGDSVFFILRTSGGGSQLWKSDGSSAGTLPITLVPRPISDLVDFGGSAFFVAQTSVAGQFQFELWRSDGTVGGTLPVKIIPPLPTNSASGIQGDVGPAVPDPPEPSAEIENVNGTLFFVAGWSYSLPNHGLWKSDGTPNGTVLVKDINRNGSINQFTAVNKTLFFAAEDGAHGRELWKSDGTSKGTLLVKDILPGGGGALPYDLTNANGTLFFVAEDGAHGRELWKSDGTSKGTVLVKDIWLGSGGARPYDLTDVNGTLFFSANGGVRGAELWKSNGTEVGTVRVADINPGAGSSEPVYLANVNGALFFAADDGVHGFELWKSDGTSAGTTMIVDLDTDQVGSTPRQLTDVNGKLFFAADDGVHGFELWKSDGTSAGTTLVKDIYPGLEDSVVGDSSSVSLTNLNGTLLFYALDSSGYRLWRSDGTSAGTTPLGNVHPVSNSRPAVVDDTLFFEGHTDFCTQLWKSDGTPAGTTLVKDVHSALSCLSPSGLTNVNGTVFFSAVDEAHDRELWKSDGTAAGTVLVKDIAAGPDSSSPGALVSAQGVLFFFADDLTHGPELWRSDGTAAGTRLVKDILPGSGGDYTNYPTSLTNANGTLFFVASDGVHGNTLWKSDGTVAGTLPVSDSLRLLGAGCGCSSWLTNVDGTLFFIADDGVHGYELWKTNGTAAGTALVKDIVPGAGSSFISELENINGTLIFTVENGDGSRALWRSDGTEDGTRPILTIAPKGSERVPASVTLSGSALFFTADDGRTGPELWSIPVSTGIKTNLDAPDLASAPAGGMAGIPISYLNTGMTAARAITLTATLDPRLTYVDDTSGITPNISGATLTWRLPGTGLLDGRDFGLRVRLPQAPLGTRLPVALHLTAAGPNGQTRSETATVNVMVAELRYVPMVAR